MINITGMNLDLAALMQTSETTDHLHQYGSSTLGGHRHCHGGRKIR